MAPRPDVSEERKGQILDAAISVFSRLGFVRARMEDVARESGLAKGTLYLYYGSKDDLIAALLRHIFGLGMRDLRSVLSDESSSGERLLQLSRQTSRDIKRLSILLPIWFEFYAVAARNEGVRRFVKGFFHEYRSSLAVIIREGIEQGEFRDADVEEVAVTLVSLFEGMTLLWAFDPDAISIERQMEASVRLLVRGLRVHTQ